MRRAKLGDAYAVKVPNGYKIIQWAYHIEKYGRFIRVFDGLYDAVPENIAEIVAGPHSYITDLYVSRAYRIGLLSWLGNYSIPEKYPFPEYGVEFCRNQHKKIYRIYLHRTPLTSDLPRFFRFEVCSIAQLPEKFQNVELLHSFFSPDWLLYLFDNGFSLEEPDILEPWIHWGENWRERYQIYLDMVHEAVNNDPLKKKKAP